MLPANGTIVDNFQKTRSTRLPITTTNSIADVSSIKEPSKASPRDIFNYNFRQYGPNDNRTLDAAILLIQAETISMGSLTRMQSFHLGSEVRENLVRSGRMRHVYEEIRERALEKGETHLVSECDTHLQEVEREAAFYGIITINANQQKTLPANQPIQTKRISRREIAQSLTLVEAKQGDMLLSIPGNSITRNPKENLNHLPRDQQIQELMHRYGVSDPRVIKLAEEHIRYSNATYTRNSPIRKELQRRGLYVPALIQKIEFFESVHGKGRTGFEGALIDAIAEQNTLHNDQQHIGVKS